MSFFHKLVFPSTRNHIQTTQIKQPIFKIDIQILKWVIIKTTKSYFYRLLECFFVVCSRLKFNVFFFCNLSKNRFFSKAEPEIIIFF